MKSSSRSTSLYFRLCEEKGVSVARQGDIGYSSITHHKSIRIKLIRSTVTDTFAPVLTRMRAVPLDVAIATAADRSRFMSPEGRLRWSQANPLCQ
ncbi:hypothetical protein E2C01_086708 [Portunus trituberculatus]|uniref:Uncharacterized protein n=1 Tax=Portunus trituberculatus TaxID=210409 RepID=A0A5B7JC65_PORTR|nr:hypothetical protein [Portunus trituberculatus]